jgi:hypothetical protein
VFWRVSDNGFALQRLIFGLLTAAIKEAVDVIFDQTKYQPLCGPAHNPNDELGHFRGSFSLSKNP